MALLDSENSLPIAALLRKKSLEPAPARARQRARPSDWRWQLKHAATTVDHLSKVLNLTTDEIAGARRAEQAGLPVRVTPYYLKLADPHDPSCPIRRQCVPHALESRVVEGDLDDPLGEVEHEVAPHLVQRYPDRALLLATDRCAVYCRFCTRSRMVGDGGGAVSLEKLRPAFVYLKDHPESATSS